MKIKEFIKKDIGIVFCIVYFSIFMVISYIMKPYFDGAYWYIVSSFQRMLFGIIELFTFVKVYKKEKWTEVIHFKNFKHGRTAGIAMFLYIPFEIITYYIFGAKEWLNTTVSIVVSCLLFQQFATGFFEELTFRAFVCEEYYQRKTGTAKSRLVYALISFVIFGIVHAIECGTFIGCCLQIYNNRNMGICFCFDIFVYAQYFGSYVYAFFH